MENKQENVNNIPRESHINFNWPAVKMKNMMKIPTDIYHELKVKKKRESNYFKSKISTISIFIYVGFNSDFVDKQL